MITSDKRIERIYSLVDKIYEKPSKKFIPGKTKVQYSGSYFGKEEVKAMMEAIFKGWFGLAWCGQELEFKLSRFIGAKSTLLTNSGSSASLLAMSALTNKYFTDRIEKGSEVITPACTFATTAASIVHAGLTPVFVDVELGTYNISPASLQKAISKKTRAIFLPHTLGNPNEMDKVVKIAKKHSLYLVEDNCDALGSSYDGQRTGSFGILATSSFYPAHHITLAGEGGAVFINDKRLERIILSLRNWGRGCWCTGLEKNPNGACGYRFDFKVDNILIDHKYYFTNLGYNLKPVEIQAAMGIAQLARYPKMMKLRKRNFIYLYKILKKLERFLILPKSLPLSDPVWFSFPITILNKSPFSRREITGYLESNGVETRTIFAGNVTRQPAFMGVKYRKAEDLPNSDRILEDTFFIGIWPGLGEKELDYVGDVLNNFFKKY